ncbi:MAG: homoserine kinase [Halobacteriales archaeon]|nr:homoserine kinase [Halobacteriales archaeon]
MIVARAPATSANLGSGFDVFGVALGEPADIVSVEAADTTSIEITGAGSQYIPEDPTQNTAGVVADALDAPAHIKIDKGVRPSSGLGSSAASAAGAAVALNELYDCGLSQEELVRVAAEGEAAVSGEAHADNVAPAIFGGFTIATADRITSVEATLPIVVCLPDIVVSTRDARTALPDSLSLEAMTRTVGNAATLTAGMFRNDPTLVGQGMDDPVVTPARAELIDGYDAVRQAAFDRGATGVTVSGAGPSILAICPTDRRRPVAAGMIDAFEAAGIDARAYMSEIGNGATVYEV